MSLWTRLLQQLGLRPAPRPRFYELEESLHATLSTLATREGRSEQEVASDLLTAGLSQYYTSDDVGKRWQSLSPREQDVTALACLGYTNKQIGLRLGISAETVKTHLGNALVKFNLHSRSELGLLLKEWDFSAWETH
jgi:DNA-binding CsgD family transcriptional regulator